MSSLFSLKIKDFTTLYLSFPVRSITNLLLSYVFFTPVGNILAGNTGYDWAKYGYSLITEETFEGGYEKDGVMYCGYCHTPRQILHMWGGDAPLPHQLPVPKRMPGADRGRTGAAGKCGTLPPTRPALRIYAPVDLCQRWRRQSPGHPLLPPLRGQLRGNEKRHKKEWWLLQPWEQALLHSQWFLYYHNGSKESRKNVITKLFSVQL